MDGCRAVGHLDLDEILDLADAHLLTVTGTGGNGKTRLTLEVATALLDEYPAGVWLLEFAPLADPVEP